MTDIKNPLENSKTNFTNAKFEGTQVSNVHNVTGSDVPAEIRDHIVSGKAGIPGVTTLVDAIRKLFSSKEETASETENEKTSSFQDKIKSEKDKENSQRER